MSKRHLVFIGKRLSSSSSGQLQERLRALTSVGQTLVMKALLVDAQLFRRKNNEVVTESGVSHLSSRFDPTVLQTKEMLTKQVRAELRKRGLDAIGKPWAVRQRLEEARKSEEEQLEALVSKIGEEPSMRAARAVPGMDIRAKYAGKLRDRLGTSVSTSKTEKGDANVLRIGREAVSSFNDDGERKSRWRIGPPGMRTLLDFASARSMSLVLLARRDTSDQELAELLRQASIHFDHVQRPSTDDANVFRDACRQLGIEPHQSLAFVDDIKAAREADRASSFSCLLRPDYVEGQSLVSSNICRVVSTCSAMVDVINEFNGTSYRATVTHPSRF